MPTYAILYKCRRCGAIENNTLTGNKDIALNALLNAEVGQDVTQYGIPVTMYSVHNCKDGRGVGVSDLIGYEQVREKNGA